MGVAINGSYWGGGGEQIDTLSGNLNLSIPLLSPKGRNDWSIPVIASYNSQNWRQDAGTTWRLGTDTGAGFGWRVGVGSLTPYYVGWTSGVDHYVFTDATGAEYNLNVNSGGVWSSNQSIYVWYDSAASTLRFKDGSFWLMGCVSAGAEGDAGSLYPTVIRNSNGNQILISWQAAFDLPAAIINTSSRIATIQDVRSAGATYTFSYDATTYAIPHLSGISNSVGTAETYSFSGYGTTQQLYPPFGTATAVPGVQLTSITVPVGSPYTFTYDASGSNSAYELTKVAFPLGGTLRWVYGSATYSSNRLIREVTSRYTATDYTGSTEWGPYAFTHSDSSTSKVVHADTTLDDASHVGAKTWTFFSSSVPAWKMGLLSQFTERASVGGTVLRRATHSWSTDSASTHPYISSTQTTVDEATANQTSKVNATVDGYGNITQQQIFDYNSLTTPVRTYTNTYLSTSTYVNAYIRDRLLTMTVADNASNSATLVSNTYDQPSLTAVSGTPTAFDSANYGTSNLVRGNVTQTVSSGVTKTFAYYQTGDVVTAADATGAGASAAYTSTTNFSAPSTATPVAGTGDVQNGHTATQAAGSSLATGYGYNSALDLTAARCQTLRRRARLSVQRQAC